MSQRRLWTPNEDEIIVALVKEHGTKKWTTIAEEMKKIITKHSRTSKQIRQRWHNHLDPCVNKKQWTIEEQIILFDSHRQFGSKWKQIANKLRGRTDNHVKNYFYSTMRRALRRVNKFLGSKNSTTHMRTIRPSILSYLLDLADIDFEIRCLVSRILELSKLKPTKLINSRSFMESEKQNYQSAIKKLMQINEAYSKGGYRKINTLQHAKTQCKIADSTQIKQQVKLQPIQKQQQQQFYLHELEEQHPQSWEDEHAESYQCHLMPQIEKPQYQCDLLIKKQQHAESSNHILLYGLDSMWAHRIQTVNLFEF